MSTLLLTLMLTASGVVEDPRGFSFTLPEGFEPFPGFKPTQTKLYAYGKNLGTPGALTLTIDVLEGPTPPGASRSCGALLNSIDRTVGTPITLNWQGTELSGLKMVMTHVFGEVLVYCVDVPVLPNGLSVVVSGKPENAEVLAETFDGVLASLSGRVVHSPGIIFVLLAAVLLVGLVVFFRLRRR